MAYRGRVLVALGLLIVAKVATVLVPVSLKYIVDSLDASRPEVLVLALPLGLVLVYGALRFATIMFGELRDAVFARVAERTLSKVSLEVFAHLLRLDLAFHLERRTGGLSRDMERGHSAISFLLRSLVFSVVPIVFEVVMVAWIMASSAGWFYALIVLLGVVAYVSFSVWMTNKRTAYIREANQRDSAANSRAVDSLINYETVKYFNNEVHEQGLYDTELAARERAKLRNTYSLALLNSGQGLIIAVCMTVIMLLATGQVADGELSLGDLAMLNALMIQVFIPLSALGFIYREIRRTLTDVEAMFQLLRITPAITDADNAIPCEDDWDGIEFRNVSFAYQAERPILQNVSFKVPAGSKVAVVGPSGAGKSTLARLLFRFYDIDSGEISVAGRNIGLLTLDSWRQRLGVVPQDTVLFNTTIADNIRYGRPGASEHELAEAIRMAHLQGFVEALPQGLDTVVGERGLKVSGGEKQRIAIARMLLKRPSVQIFDEATSSLDSIAEQAILEALDEVAVGHTTIVIAHRLSTVVDADNIVVLDQGKVVESGSHQQLLAAHGVYWSMWQLQQAEQQSG
jgi:ATP-binding cassette subfamily B protein